MTTILGALRNAIANLDAANQIISTSRAQIHNSLTLIQKGYDFDIDMDALLTRYGTVENVPSKLTNNGNT